MNPRSEPACSICGDTGWRPANVPLPGQVLRFVRCDCWLQRRNECADGVPLEFKSARFANYAVLAGNKTAVAAASAFAGGEGDLYLCGAVGSGKSRLAATIANELNLAGKDVLFERVPRLLLRLQPSRDDDETDRARELLRELTSRPFLVLDDLGAERESASDFTRRTLLIIYEERGDKGLRTIWTSNMRLSGREGRFPPLSEFMNDDRLSSRILGRARVVLLTTPDQRPPAVRRAREAGEEG